MSCAQTLVHPPRAVNRAEVLSTPSAQICKVGTGSTSQCSKSSNRRPAQIAVSRRKFVVWPKMVEWHLRRAERCYCKASHGILAGLRACLRPTVVRAGRPPDDETGRACFSENICRSAGKFGTSARNDVIGRGAQQSKPVDRRRFCLCAPVKMAQCRTASLTRRLRCK